MKITSHLLLDLTCLNFGLIIKYKIPFSTLEKEKREENPHKHWGFFSFFDYEMLYGILISKLFLFFYSVLWAGNTSCPVPG